MKCIKKKPQKINPKEIQKSYLETVENDLTDKGVVFFDAPDVIDEYLTLPASVTDVSSRELGEYLNAFTQQKMYMRTLLGRTELMCEELKRKYLDASKEIYKALSNGKMSETAKERLINSEEKVKPAYYEYTSWCSKVHMLELNIANIEDAIFLLSREVSRRTSDFEDENRNYNVGKK